MGLRCGGVFCIAKFVTDSLVVVVEVCGGMVVLVVDAIRGGVFSKMNWTSSRGTVHTSNGSSSLLDSSSLDSGS